MPQTLEQLRAEDAWQKAQDCSDEYMKLAKGLPALIMNSGLLQVMAFLEEKGSKEAQRHCQHLGAHLRQWLATRYPDLHNEFGDFMQAMMRVEPRQFQAITQEALDWLRWLRQMSAAARAGR